VTLLRSLVFLPLAVSCVKPTSPPQGATRAREDDAATLRASQSITAADLRKHIEVLASDAFEGRAPATQGEERTVAYLVEQFKKARVAPGNPDGTYVQDVPMVGVTSRASLRLEPLAAAKVLRPGDDFVLWSYGREQTDEQGKPNTEDVRIDASDILFVGYGAEAAEWGWDDFKGVDVTGKTLLFLIGDPPVVDPSDATRLDPRVFRGPAMTYYGRWTYKYETARKKGARAALIVHETGPAGYGWGVVEAGLTRERFDLALGRHVLAEGWIQRDVARALFEASGEDFERQKAAAARRDFRPVPRRGARATAEVHVESRPVRSRNVVARLVGSDPQRREECVILSAHWDHLGRDPKRSGHQVFSGALDNASGVAWLLEIAEAFSKLPRAPSRSVLFMAVTAEEYGLLGSRYYASHPLYPLDRTLANVNMDVMNPWGRTRAVVSLGLGQTTMDTILAEEAARQNRRVVGDPEPEKGYFYRSDHFELARVGVPALGFLFPGADYIGKPADFGAKKRADYVAHVYHTPNDVVQADWDLEGAVEDTQLGFRVGLRIAESDRWPSWLEGSEFRARRPVTPPPAPPAAPASRIDGGSPEGR
jgi:Zn-dependent M28 family amino/carboxypeptidase